MDEEEAVDWLLNGFEEHRKMKPCAEDGRGMMT